nr:hypothetical protein [uncultured bacterium]
MLFIFVRDVFGHIPYNCLSNATSISVANALVRLIRTHKYGVPSAVGISAPLAEHMLTTATAFAMMHQNQ